MHSRIQYKMAYSSCKFRDFIAGYHSFTKTAMSSNKKDNIFFEIVSS